MDIANLGRRTWRPFCFQSTSRSFNYPRCGLSYAPIAQKVLDLGRLAEGAALLFMAIGRTRKGRA
jgi:hypothetical protein